MKKIEAIIRPSKFEAVKEALKSIGIAGMTVIEVRGHGRQNGQPEIYCGREYVIELVPKVKVELMVDNDRGDEVVKTVIEAARTGQFGDGKIFVLDLGDAIRIRSDERGHAAL